MLGLLYLLSGVAVQNTAMATEVVFGMQLNDDAADSYGSSMAYDAKTHRLYITGGTYSGYFKTGMSHQTQDTSPMSDCFFGVLQLPTQVFMSPQWIRRVQIGMSDVSEACSSLYVSQKNGDIYLMGHSAHSSSVLAPLEEDTISVGDSDYSNLHPTATTAGLVMHLSRGANLVGGIIMDAGAVQYPIAVQGDADSKHLFVASIKSKDSHVNPSFTSMKNRAGSNAQMDMSTAGYLPPEYGSNYTVVLKSLQRRPISYADSTAPGFDKSELRQTLEITWSREYGLDMSTSLQVSSLLYVSPSILIMAGSTQASSTAESANDGIDIDIDIDSQVDSAVGENWDGFLLGIDPVTGDQLAAQRIRSNPQGDDRILGLCKREINDDSEDDTTATEDIYLVGITEGLIEYSGISVTEARNARLSFQKGSYSAFLLKMNARTMEIKWISYVGAAYDDVGELQPPQVHGMACSVTADGEDVYMAGSVKDGAILKFDPADAANVNAESHGGDDIFVAQYKTLDGTLNWAKQMGTAYDDSLGQGTSLVSNANGDAVVLGNTNGSLMRKKASPSTTDMFVLSLARKRGNHLPFFETMMESGPTDTSDGFSKNTNPYYFDSETDETPIDTLPQPTDSTRNNGQLPINQTDSSGNTQGSDTSQDQVSNATSVPVSNSTYVQNESLVQQGSALSQNGTYPVPNSNETFSSSSRNETENGTTFPLQSQNTTSLSPSNATSGTPVPLNVTAESEVFKESDTPGQSPNLRTQRPTSLATRPPLLPVIVVDSDEGSNINDEGEADSKILMPYVIALVVLANVIVAIILVLIYLYRHGGLRSRRVVPGLDDDIKNTNSSTSQSISSMMPEGRWKADGMPLMQDQSESSSMSVLHRSLSHQSVDGQILMELRPPCPPPPPPMSHLTPLHPVSGSFDQCQQHCENPLLPVSVHSQASFSMEDSFDSDIPLGDKYDNEDVLDSESLIGDKYDNGESYY